MEPPLAVPAYPWLAETAPLLDRLAAAGRLAAAERSWYDIPAVQLVGGVLGAVLLVAAIRSMFGKRR